MDNYETDFFEVKIKAKSDPYYKSLNEVYNKGYSGNIIINNPNAKYIKMSGYYPHVVAPMADIESSSNGAPALVYGTLICNSFTGNGSGVFYHSPYNSDDDFVDETMDIYRYEYEDFKDDLYYGNYSIAEMLQNYSVVALGHNDYTGGKFKSLNYPKGSVDIFHIAGNFLVRGNVGSYANSYPGFVNVSGREVFGYMRLDLESSFINESYYGSVIAQKYYKKSWADFTGGDSVNKIYTKQSSDGENIVIQEDYINFERLYSSVVEQQKLIPTETVVIPDEKGFLYLSIGGNYLIEDISKVNTIFFDDFEQNENKVTSITIKNSGSMRLPIVFRNDDERYLSTNDYYGKKNATHRYESNGNSATQFGPDYYHGNIIWNVPNATNITLASGAPFVGHLIAPNADVVTPELHFAGCFIVNSLDTSNATEAHFYPLQIVPEYLKNSTGVLGENETVDVIPVGTPPVPEEPEVDEPEVDEPEVENPKPEEPKEEPESDVSGGQIENPPTSSDFVGLVILTFGISLVIFINLMKRMKKGI